MMRERRPDIREMNVELAWRWNVFSRPQTFCINLDTALHSHRFKLLSTNIDWLGGLDPNGALRSGDPIDRRSAGIAARGDEKQMRPPEELYTDGRPIRELRPSHG